MRGPVAIGCEIDWASVEWLAEYPLFCEADHICGMRESRIVGANKDVHSHSGGVTRYDGDVAIVGDQCFGGYSLCAIILVETVPWHARIPAPREILPPR